MAHLEEGDGMRATRNVERKRGSRAGVIVRGQGDKEPAGEPTKGQAEHSGEPPHGLPRTPHSGGVSGVGTCPLLLSQ